MENRENRMAELGRENQKKIEKGNRKYRELRIGNGDSLTEKLKTGKENGKLKSEKFECGIKKEE